MSRTVATQRYAQTYVAPAIADWKTLLLRNQRVDHLQDARRQVFVAAIEYTRHLRQLAQDRGIATTWPDLTFNRNDFDTTNSPGCPLVMTGHQPNLFHAGIHYKYELTERFCREQNLLGVSVMLDTDVGHPGAFDMPERPGERRDWATNGRTRETLALPHGALFRNAKVGDDIGERIEHVVGEFRYVTSDATADRVQRQLEPYRDLVGVSMMDANAIVRRAAGHHRHLLEVPMSDVVSLDPVRRWLESIVARGRSLSERYNRALHAWRQQNKVRGNANPFPDLAAQSGATELPVWGVDLEAGRRYSVWAQEDVRGIDRIGYNPESTDGTSTAPRELVRIPDEFVLVPRGALISATFRGVCSDLFVHGLGGESYDRFTNDWYQEEFGRELPAYTVASADAYLFPLQRLETFESLSDPSFVRNVAHHPEEKLGTDFFEAPDRAAIESLLREKSGLIQEMQHRKQTGSSAASQGKRLQAIKREIQVFVEQSCARQLADFDAAPTAEQRDALRCRTYPWFAVL